MSVGIRFSQVADISDETRFLSATEQGDLKASEQALPLVSEELRKFGVQRKVKENSS